MCAILVFTSSYFACSTCRHLSGHIYRGGSWCKMHALQRGSDGDHAYKKVWAATICEQLLCQSEQGNVQDVFAVAVLKDVGIVGHVPQKYSTSCCMFLCQGSSILCQVTESKHYLAYLLQVDLEILCTLVFVGSVKDTARVEQVITVALHSTAKDHQQVPKS